MTAKTALPLTQQVLAWALQAMGLIDDLSKVSRSTVKNAMRGDVVWQAWDGLVDEAVRAVRLDIGEDQRELLRQGLPDIDGRFAALDALGLDNEDLLPPVLRLLLPQVGLRLGALAAMVEGGLWPEARSSTPELAKWLCDPLSPGVFGRIVEGLLVKHHPDWATWSERKDQLDQRGIVSKRAVERWRSGSVLAVPNISNVVALGSIMGSDDDQRVALLLLRLGRLLSVARRSLAEWLGATQADGIEAGLRSWAEVTRRALTSPEFMAELGELLGQGLSENPSLAAEFVAARKAFWGQLLDGITPENVGEALFREGRLLRAGEGGAMLRGLVVDQVLQPNPVVIAAVGQQLGADNMLLAATADPAEVIQGQWGLAKLFSLVAGGEPFSWGADSPTAAQKEPSPALRDQARHIQGHLRTVVRQPGEPPLNQMDLMRFWFGFAAEAGGMGAVNAMVSAWNSASQMMAVPAFLEPMVDDEVVEQAPHLAPLRAARLAEAGEEKDAIQWLGRWKREASTATEGERRAAAATTLSLAHRCLDRVAGLADALPREDREHEADDVQAVLHRASGIAREAIARSVALADQLLDLAAGLLRPVDPAQRAPELLILAVRTDCIDAALADVDDVELVRGTPIANELRDALGDSPKDPTAWAALALWQELTGDDAGFALKQAQHFGGETAYRKMRARLVGDGLLDPG